MIILKVTKKQGFTLSLEDTFFEKPQGEVKLIPPAVLGLKSLSLIIRNCLNSGTFLDESKKANNIPVHKKIANK